LFPLQPLEAPTEDLSDAVQALKYSAVALFVDRARAIEPQFNVDPDAAVDLGRICRRLNGVPLAIEIAAASVSVVGLRELANRLSSGFEHVRNQRRTSAERHRTLRAVFSWSYDLLAEDAKALLRRLAIIPTSFTLEEAGAVAIGGPVDDLVTLVKLIEDLHRKSLIVVDMRTAPPRYKLLETTRAFAFERLLESEISAAFAGLCRHFLSVVRSDRRLSAAATLSDIRANYVSDVENIRAAIEWAFQQPQTAQFGIELTLSTTPIWLALSAFEECVLHCGRALSWLKRLHGDHHTEKLKLSITSCIAQMWVQGPRSELVKTLRAMVEAAENTSDEESRLRASYGVWLFHLRTGKYREALDLAERFVGVTNATDSAAWLTGQRMMAVSEHYVGHHSQARKRLDVLLRNAASGFLHAEYVLRFGVDQHIAALAAQVRVLFVQGYGHDARHLLDKSLAEAQKLGHVNSLCLLLAEAACVISMLVDDLQATAHFAAQLFQVAEKHGLGLWRRHALAFQTWVQAKTGDPAEGVEILLAAVRDWGPDYRQAIFAGELAKMLASLDRISESRAIIANAVDLADSGQWCIPELIRIGAEVECAAGALDLAEEKLNVALKLARRRGQRLWELKSAISLAQLLANRGDCKDVRRILLPVVESNAGEIEGLELRTARRILDAIVD
jgi:predicted ATPase